MFKQKKTNMFLKALEQIQYGSIELTMPDNRQYQFVGNNAGPRADLTIEHHDVITSLSQSGDIGFAEQYQQGNWHSNNIAALIECALHNRAGMQQYINGSRARKWLAQLTYLFSRNTKAGSKRNIHHHYDLGNQFYALWLDPSMTYSSALFAGTDDLLTAQNHKYDRILNRVQNHEHILEIGCGWGGFADRATSTGDHKVNAITISNQQYDYARQRLADKNADIALQDYRDTSGRYDAIVSIEMFEATGERYWPMYFNRIKSLLRKGGNAIIQTITIADEHFDSYRSGSDSIRSYIFPGGMLPSRSRFAQEAQNAQLRVVDQFAFGKDYASTLLCWLDRFDSKQAQVRDLGFDDSFIRLWRFYLSACSGAFAANHTDVVQFELHHA